QLNVVTEKIAFPLPLIRTILDRLKRFKYFTKLDIRKGFNNIRTTKGTEALLAFICELGQFLCTVMPFGAMNAPAHFQSWMNDILKLVLITYMVFCYIDDILICANTLEELRDLTAHTLEILRQNNLTVNPAKCEFEREEVVFLGWKISQGTNEKSEKLCSGLEDWLMPTCARDTRSFATFASYHRRFIPNFATLAAPLHRLTGKGEFKITDEAIKSFNNLKRAIKDSVQAAIPLDDQPWRIETDASGIATAAILYQQQEDGNWRMVDCISAKLRDAQLNYDVYNLEMLAVIRALEEWQHYLLGQPFEIYTDHKNLSFFWKPNPLNGQQNRWRQFLSMFDFKIVLQPGKTNK